MSKDYPKLITIPVTAADIDVMARTIYGEARGEPELGKVAVAWVIRNRAEIDLGGDGKPDWWGEGLAGVCQSASKKGVFQFSCWSEGDPNRKAMQEATFEQLAECYFVAVRVLLGVAPDPTGGSAHYYADTMGAPPKWANGEHPEFTIGHHRFFKLPEVKGTVDGKPFDPPAPAPSQA